MKKNRIQNIPSQEFLKSVLVYDETSESCLRWIKSTAIRIKIGDRAGCLKHDKRNGYSTWEISICNNICNVSNVIYKLIYGVSPESGFVIDHINRISTDNRIENLRIVTINGNNANRSRNKRYTTTGVTGVSYNDKGNNYVAYGNIPNEGRKYLGSFINIKDAIYCRITHMLKYYKNYCDREVEYVKNSYPDVYLKIFNDDEKSVDKPVSRD